MYKCVRKGLAEIYEDEPEAFGPASVSENPFKDEDDVHEFDLREHQVKVKTGKEQKKEDILVSFLLSLNFLFTRCYYISTRAEIFHIISIVFQLGIPSFNFNPG